jgi:hypothetical protein
VLLRVIFEISIPGDTQPTANSRIRPATSQPSGCAAALARKSPRRSAASERVSPQRGHRRRVRRRNGQTTRSDRASTGESSRYASRKHTTAPSGPVPAPVRCGLPRLTRGRSRSRRATRGRLPLASTVARGGPAPPSLGTKSANRTALERAVQALRSATGRTMLEAKRIDWPEPYLPEISVASPQGPTLVKAWRRGPAARGTQATRADPQPPRTRLMGHGADS